MQKYLKREEPQSHHKRINNFLHPKYQVRALMDLKYEINLEAKKNAPILKSHKKFLNKI